MIQSENAPVSATIDGNQTSSGVAWAALSDLAGKLDELIDSYAPRGAGRAADSPGTLPAPPAETCVPSDLPSATQGPATRQDRTELPPTVPTRDESDPDRTAEASNLAAEFPQGSLAHWAGLRESQIMIVDDEEVNVLTVRHHLKKEGLQNFIVTTNPREAIDLMRSRQPDVVLLDIRMPQVSGIDILGAKHLDSSLSHIPVLVLTAANDPQTKRRALELGATDFLTKPVDPNDLIPRVRNALVVKRHFDQMANQAAKLEELVRRRTTELMQSRQELILSLARAAEHRDNETGNHVIRVGRYAGIIAKELGWSAEQVEMLEHAAQLHDVGKIGVPDAILFKPDKLEPAEFDIIKRHCAVGHRIITPLSERDFQLFKSHARIGENILHVRGSPMLMMASRIAQTHHENWDGTGYPLGLAGEDIPLEGRITAVADVYDALSSKRAYKDAFPREKCFEILESMRGKKFDPRVLDAFFRRGAEIVEVQISLMDDVSVDPAMFTYYAERS